MAMKAAILKVATSRKFWIGFNLFAWGCCIAGLALEPRNPVPVFCALVHAYCIANLVEIEKEEE